MKQLKFLVPTLYLFFVKIAHAADPPPIGLNAGKQPGGLSIAGNNPQQLTQNLLKNTITLFFSIGAIGFIIMMMWGAVSWILSGGDKEKIAGARKRISTAIIGLVLLSLTFTITLVVGQILGIDALQYGDIRIPGLLDK